MEPQGGVVPKWQLSKLLYFTEPDLFLLSFAFSSSTSRPCVSPLSPSSPSCYLSASLSVCLSILPQADHQHHQFFSKTVSINWREIC